MDNPPVDEHIIDTVGKYRILVHNGQVVEIGEPARHGALLANRREIPVYETGRDGVKKTIGSRIRLFGVYADRRKVISDKEFFEIAPAEVLACGLRSGMIDAVVFPCYGAGTVIITSPSMAPGAGGLLSGLVLTSPIPVIMDRIEEHGGIVFDRVSARLDPLGGATLAKKTGFSHIAVLVSDPESAETIRAHHPGALIFGVHLSGITREGARRIVAVSDLVTGSASITLGTIGEEKALLQVRAVIPVVALTPRGKRDPHKTGIRN